MSEDIYSPELRLKTTLETLGENVQTILDKNHELVAANVNQARIILDLQARLDTARRSFGEAFLYGDVRQGPKRPNRKKLSEHDAKDIRQAHRGGATQAQLAANYEVNPATISRIVRGIYH